MEKKRKHLKLGASISIGCSLFIGILTAVLSLISYNTSRNVLYSRYQAQMESIVSIAEAHVDIDDMCQCVETLTKSAKYQETQDFFDKFVDNYSDLHYLYILSVRPEGSDDAVFAVCSASTTYEKTYEPEGVLDLGDSEAEWYSQETTQLLRDIMAGDEDVYFFEDSSWGSDYTLARPLISGEKHYALLCVDISTETISGAINNIVLTTVIPIVCVGIAFFAILMVWLFLSVVRPIRKVQNSVFDYANKTHGKRNPDELAFKAPKLIYASREIQNLSSSVEKLSQDMRDYVMGLLQKEEEVETLDVVAHRDALTGLYNKAAYDRDVIKINQQINEGTAEFAIVMSDINYLKDINDRFGHENGDKYIIGVCNIIRDVYQNSPIYRVGGDEIVVILQGEDYQNRNRLLKTVKNKFIAAFSNEKSRAYKRYSAACGMATYRPGKDKDVDTVFQRADKEMYKNKAEIKGMQEIH